MKFHYFCPELWVCVFSNIFSFKNCDMLQVTLLYIFVDFDSRRRGSPHVWPIYFQLLRIRLSGWRCWNALKDFHLNPARCWFLCSCGPALSSPVRGKKQPCWYVLYTFARPHVCLSTKSFIFPFAFHFNWPSFHICQRATPLVPVLPPSHHPARLSRWP